MISFEQVKDIKKLANLTSEIWHEYWNNLLSQEQIVYMIDKFQSEKAIHEQIKNEKYIYFFIKYDGKISGYLGLSHKNDYLFLSKIYIKKEFRHKGLGTKSFEFIKNYGIENNYDKIRLTVNKYNKNTIKAYNKWGFTTIDSVVTDIGSGFVMDDFIMEYKLNKK